MRSAWVITASSAASFMRFIIRRMWPRESRINKGRSTGPASSEVSFSGVRDSHVARKSRRSSDSSHALSR